MNRIAAYVNEVERRFRERTPARTVDEVVPEYRVGVSEMRLWWLLQYGTEMTFDENLEAAMQAEKLFKRLKKEFPNEGWPGKR